MLIHQPIPLVLASGSVIRAQMLKQLGLHFSVVPAVLDELALQREVAQQPINEQALHLARAKAQAVGKEYPDRLILAADQMCELNGHVFHKPGGMDAAMEQLRQLNGKSHRQHCGTVLLRDGKIVWEHTETATLAMRELATAEMDFYLRQDEPFSSCGSYKFESLGRHLFAKVEGDHDVVKGLPLVPLLAALHTLGAVKLTAGAPA